MPSARAEVLMPKRVRVRTYEAAVLALVNAHGATGMRCPERARSRLPSVIREMRRLRRAIRRMRRRRPPLLIRREGHVFLAPLIVRLLGKGEP